MCVQAYAYFILFEVAHFTIIILHNLWDSRGRSLETWRFVRNYAVPDGGRINFRLQLTSPSQLYLNKLKQYRKNHALRLGNRTNTDVVTVAIIIR